MKKYIFIICAVWFCIPLSIFAIENPDCNKSDFSCYKNWRDNYCRKDDSPWNNAKIYPELGKVTLDYVEFSSSAMNAHIAQMINSEKNPSEKARLEKELDSTRIGSFRGYKAGEIARVQYRNNMNKIFSCAVLASRIQTIELTSELIKKTVSSEIQDKLKKDAEKLKKSVPANCSTVLEEKKKSYSTLLVRSVTTEYCSYVFYNEYLMAQIDQDKTRTFDIETKIGKGGENATLPANLQDYANVFSTYANQLRANTARAKSTLPKALIAYREMERTYAIHIMLTIIYDDYIELRQNLSTYLNAVSQLYKKAQNAQSANQK